jgi:hypothetical protein
VKTKTTEYEKNQAHLLRVEAKQDRIAGKRDLQRTHELCNPNRDLSYEMKLRRRIMDARKDLRNMVGTD